MHHMSRGAEVNGLTIELCTAYPRHTLQALEMPTVTFVSVCIKWVNNRKDGGEWVNYRVMYCVSQTHTTSAGDAYCYFCKFVWNGVD